MAEYILRRDPVRTLLLDGRPFSKRIQVEKVVRLAERVEHRLCVIHCWAPDPVVYGRLEKDMRHTGNVAAGRNMEKYLRIKKSFEPLTIEHLSVNTDQPTEEIVRTVMAYLERCQHGS